MYGEIQSQIQFVPSAFGAGTFAINCHRGNSVHTLFRRIWRVRAPKRFSTGDRSVIPTTSATTRARARTHSHTHSCPFRHGSKQNTRGRQAPKCLEGAASFSRAIFESSRRFSWHKFIRPAVPPPRAADVCARLAGPCDDVCIEAASLPGTLAPATPPVT